MYNYCSRNDCDSITEFESADQANPSHRTTTSRSKIQTFRSFNRKSNHITQMRLRSKNTYTPSWRWSPSLCPSYLITGRLTHGPNRCHRSSPLLPLHALQKLLVPQLRSRLHNRTRLSLHHQPLPTPIPNLRTHPLSPIPALAPPIRLLRPLPKRSDPRFELQCLHNIPVTLSLAPSPFEPASNGDAIDECTSEMV
jgi:hypothetical protein